MKIEVRAGQSEVIREYAVAKAELLAMLDAPARRAAAKDRLARIRRKRLRVLPGGKGEPQG